jgi:hypothetical protein
VKTPILRLVFSLVVCLGSSSALAQNASTQSLKPNQTLGYGADQLLLFTYTQTFDCVDQPLDDLNFNGVPAQSDPSEFQIPICQAGIQPTIDPTGLHGGQNDPTEPLYVLVPMFSVDNDQNPSDAISCNGVVPGTNCGAALGHHPDPVVWCATGSIQNQATGLHAVPGWGASSRVRGNLCSVLRPRKFNERAIESNT